MNWRLFVKGIGAAAWGGAATALSQALLIPGGVNVTRVGLQNVAGAAFGGAVAAVLAYFHPSPLQNQG
ncbi:MAG: hypothetical protein ACYC6M_14065 [Terriglobales bacterium]